MPTATACGNAPIRIKAHGWSGILPGRGLCRGGRHGGVPVSYDYGIELAGTNGAGTNITSAYVKEINGAASEWIKTYTDMAGRQYKTVYAAATTPYPFRQSFYDNMGLSGKNWSPTAK